MVSHEQLLSLLRYDKDRGRFFWLKTGRGIKPSKNGEAGSIDVHGYGQVSLHGKVYKEHRLVWFYVYGEWPNGQIDHINHDRRDNRIENLRIVDNEINHRNRPKQQNNKTGMPGVWKMPDGRYQAYINVKGKRFHLGKYRTLDEAKRAREEANKLHGFHENHGAGVGKSRVEPIGNSYKSNAKLIEHNGQKKLATEWAKVDGCSVSASIIRSRIKQGWNVRDAIFKQYVTHEERDKKRQRLENGQYATKTK